MYGNHKKMCNWQITWLFPRGGLTDKRPTFRRWKKRDVNLADKIE
jgi:hypothetical protein